MSDIRKAEAGPTPKASVSARATTLIPHFRRPLTRAIVIGTADDRSDRDEVKDSLGATDKPKAGLDMDGILRG